MLSKITRFVIIILFLSASIQLWADNIPDRESSYLGQIPPGDTAVLFASEILLNGTHSSPSFSADCGEVYWSRYYKPEGRQTRVQHIFFSKLRDGRWTEPAVAEFSGKYNDGGPCLTRDGDRLFFYSNRPASGSGEPADDYISDIWYVDRADSSWGQAQRLSINTSKDEGSLSISDDGTLYFTSNRKGSYGIFDIFKSEPVPGGYGRPKNIGAPITTAHIEFSPLIAPDESFIVFAYQNRPEGNGLYISFKKDNGAWGIPVCLGPEINAGPAQRFPGLSPDGKYFFFSRESRRSRQIYWIDAGFIDSLRNNESN